MQWHCLSRQRLCCRLAKPSSVSCRPSGLMCPGEVTPLARGACLHPAATSTRSSRPLRPAGSCGCPPRPRTGSRPSAFPPASRTTRGLQRSSRGPSRLTPGAATSACSSGRASCWRRCSVVALRCQLRGSHGGCWMPRQRLGRPAPTPRVGGHRASCWVSFRSSVTWRMPRTRSRRTSWSSRCAGSSSARWVGWCRRSNAAGSPLSPSFARQCPARMRRTGGLKAACTASTRASRAVCSLMPSATGRQLAPLALSTALPTTCRPKYHSHSQVFSQLAPP
mmetsp:Transcript_87577/g.248231  ORF Transcript_87577/g.248231 Transcript_87577/m.248231 type:complete len:279 (-) Transcript_87577:319-1155(-)